MLWWDIQFDDDSPEWREYQRQAKENTEEIGRLLEVLQSRPSKSAGWTPEAVRKLRDQWQGNRDWWNKKTPEEQR